MYILMRHDQTKDWKVVDSARFGNEAELQELIAESPYLIPVHEIREDLSPLVVSVSEVGLPGSGSTDILAFSAVGDIAIIECKLAANPESKRKVIGQILEYGAYLWGITYEELDQRISQRRGKSLAELVAEAVGDPEWDEEAFRGNVRESLTNGTFILVIAVDETNEELSRTIRFLNGCGNPAFSIHALEMRWYPSGETEVLVPHLHGPSLLDSAKGKPRRRKWTEEEFFNSIQGELSHEVVSVIRDLYEWELGYAPSYHRFGKGIQIGSFTFYHLLQGEEVPVFSVNTNGSLYLNYNSLLLRFGQDVVNEFHRSIVGIPSFSHVPADFSKYPLVKIADAFVDQPGALEQFKDAVQKLGDRIRL